MYFQKIGIKKYKELLIYKVQRDFFKTVCKIIKYTRYKKLLACITNIRSTVIIYKSRLFKPYFISFKKKSKLKLIYRYVSCWQADHDLKKPMPGFHPGIYSSRVSLGGIDPFAHYIKNGLPKGEWTYPVITSQDEAKKTTSNAALQLHLFYHEMAEEIIKRLIILKNRPDLLISVTTNEAKDYISKILKRYCSNKFLVRVVPNRGRDIGPFLTEFKNEIRNYEIIGHFHTKVSPHLSNRDDSEQWFNFLLENVIGGVSPMLDITLSAMASNPKIGLVFPEDPHVFGWDKNYHQALQIAKGIGIKTPLNNYFNFPAGTMFWARYQAIKPLFDLNFEWEDYPTEPIGHDGTMLHAIERLIPFVTLHSGFKIAVTNVPSVTY